MNESLNVTVQAKRIFATGDNVIENGTVEIKDGRIVDVSKSKTPSAKVHDLGDVALVPGLVNAHTHLEFSDLPSPLGEPGMPFTDWLKLVIKNRMEATNKAAAIRKGVQESKDAGVVAIGEIATAPIDLQNYSKELDTTIFLERLTRNSDLWRSVFEECESWCDERADPDFKRTISPHAPYSVHPNLLQSLVELSVQRNCPLAIHLAETPEEIELLSQQTGPFVDFLITINAWYPETYSAHQTIADILNVIAQAPRSLVVHGNFLTDEEIEIIVANKKTMSVVFCPRTHAYFEHPKHPLENLLDAGINVAIGTDSRASNPDLSLFNELKMLRSRFPRLSDERILQLGTQNGLTALGMNSCVGQIAVGNAAQFNVIQNVDGSLFSTDSVCTPILNGRFSF